MGDAILQADNAAIINKVRANASLEYQSRIPVVTQANLSKTFATLQAYQPMWNEFMDVLINRIGLTLFNQNSFTNRLKPLKSGAMNYGGMIQEIGANLLHAEAYDPNDTNVFGGEKADVEAFLSYMAPAGRLFALEERLQDAGSAVAGCGPAFAAMFLEALADGGVACGLPRVREQPAVPPAEVRRVGRVHHHARPAQEVPGSGRLLQLPGS